jgi:hypothetical protein
MGVTVTLPDGAAKWLDSGEQGLSSKSIFTKLSDLNIMGDWSRWGLQTPSDPDDLRRCILLLDMVPEWRERIFEMSVISDKWAAAARHWAELDNLFNEECPNWRSNKYAWRAPKTYERMKEIGL